MASLVVLLWHGASLFDRLIEHLTRSPYCHAAILDAESGRLYEALGSGVRKLEGSAAHERAASAACTIPVAVSAEQRDDAVRFLEGEVGRSYPWTTCVTIGIARLSGCAWDCAPAGTYVCSSLVAEALARAGVLDVPDAQQCSPGDLARFLQSIQEHHP